MPAPSDAVPSFHPAAGSSWASAASSALSDVEPWSSMGGMLAGGPRLRASPALDPRPGTVGAGLTATEQASAPAGTCVANLGLTEWTMGSSVVVSVTGEVDIASTAQISGALGAAVRSSANGLIYDLTGVSFLGQPAARRCSWPDGGPSPGTAGQSARAHHCVGSQMTCLPTQAGGRASGASLVHGRLLVCAYPGRGRHG
ncbi:MAG: STAS domain-containing protein [Acidimicrobiales bacterium]